MYEKPFRHVNRRISFLEERIRFRTFAAVLLDEDGTFSLAVTRPVGVVLYTYRYNKCGFLYFCAAVP